MELLKRVLTTCFLLEEVSKAIEAVGFNKRARRSNMCNAKMKEIVITAYMYKRFLSRNYQCDECVNDQKALLDTLQEDL